MTNPNNSVGTNGAFGGRTSVNAFNDGIAAYTSGILSGWGCSPDSGLTVVLGGDGNTRDVAIAEDNSGNKTTINNISGSPISVTVGNAPNNNSRIDSIVAYVDNPPTGSSTITDNYEACGLIVVSGSVASTPVAPNESAIRSAITADGASGTTAYYVVLANVTVASGTTDLTSDDIEAGTSAGITSNNIDFTTVMPEIYETIYSGTGSSSVTVSKAVENYDSLLVTIKDPGHNKTGTAVVAKGYTGSIAFAASGGGYLRFVIATINTSGTTVSLSDRYIVYISGQSSSPNVTYGDSGAAIIKVVGIAKAAS